MRPSVQLALEALLLQQGHAAASVSEAAAGRLTACRTGRLRLPLVIGSSSGSVTATAAAAAEAVLLDAAHAVLAEKSCCAVLLPTSQLSRFIQKTGRIECIYRFSG